MKKFYVTFGQSNPLRNGWVVILAPNWETSRLTAFEIFSTKFSTVYDEDVFEAEHFPAGQHGETVFAPIDLKVKELTT